MPALPAHTAGKQACVLVVDDEAAVLQVIAEGLRDAGFAVIALGNAADALALLDRGEVVDILVSDLSMPDVDGLVLIREAQRRRPHLPAVLLTGFPTDTAPIAIRGVLSGSFSLLRKPIDPHALAERVSILLKAVEPHESRTA